jgi:phenylacetate-coenzyme A ligase PaaK-like adenylate-forming protein
VSFERLRRIVPGMLASTTQVLSVLEPMTRLAGRLQAMQPGVLITYPSCAAALAQMQMRGELRIRPAEVWLGGEQVSAMQRERLVQAFGCTVRNAYGSSEFYSMAFECSHGQLHLNSDWVVLEAVDAHMRPVPAGELSHCALLTNLANATQPLLRYRLDDRIRFVAQPCRCGSAFAAIQVEGRADETLSLPGRSRRPVTILPLALETAIEEQARVTQFQILCRPGGRLELRLEAGVVDAAGAARRCRVAVAVFLEGHGVLRTDLSFSTEAPLRHACSGKLQRVVNVATA